MRRNIQKLNAFNLFNEGFNIYQVHKEIGVPESTVARWFKEYKRTLEASKPSNNDDGMGVNGGSMGVSTSNEEKAFPVQVNVAYIIPPDGFLRIVEAVKNDPVSDYERSQTVFKMYTGFYRYFCEFFKFENLNLPILMLIADIEMKAARGLRDGLIDTDRFAKNTRCGVVVKEEREGLRPSSEMTAEEISIELREFSNRNRGN